jgi:hypothetical protein
MPDLAAARDDLDTVDRLEGTTAAASTVRCAVSQLHDPSLVRHGRVNGRYFRENFAQGGIDLVQIIPERTPCATRPSRCATARTRS